MNSIGEKIIDAIIGGKLMTMQCPDSPESDCLAVWSANATEQLTELVHREFEVNEQLMTTWKCGCGAVNGVGLEKCRVCRRHPNGGDQ